MGERHVVAATCADSSRRCSLSRCCCWWSAPGGLCGPQRVQIARGVAPPGGVPAAAPLLRSVGRNGNGAGAVVVNRLPIDADSAVVKHAVAADEQAVVTRGGVRNRRERAGQRVQQQWDEPKEAPLRW